MVFELIVSEKKQLNNVKHVKSYRFQAKFENRKRFLRRFGFTPKCHMVARCICGFKMPILLLHADVMEPRVPKNQWLEDVGR